MATLYLPDTLINIRSDAFDGYLYGWTEAGATIAAGVTSGEYEQALERVERAGRRLGMSLRIVGKVNLLGAIQACDPRDQDETIRHLFSLEIRKGHPHAITTFENKTDAPRVIYYSPPGRLEMLSLRSIPLDLGPLETGASASSTSFASRKEAPRRSTTTACSSKMETALAVDRINLSPATVKHVEAQNSTRHELRPCSRAFNLLARLAQAGFEINIAILSFQFPWVGALRDVSIAARQIATRLELLRAAPQRYLSYLSSRSRDPYDNDERLDAFANYIRFWNTVWLFLNDLIVGYALSAFVRDNAQESSNLIGTLVQTYISGYLRDLLQWLNDWPGGVKLNTELSSLICDSFLFLSRLWDGFVLTPFLPHLPFGLELFSTLGFVGGASLLLAFASDLFNLLTFPFFGCYVAATLVYRWSLVGLSALFNVFRGKKYNPLRARTEPATYSVDALLLGTILFVALIFLFPTIAAFYLAFASSRLMIVAVQASINVAVQALNAFPLFALMLRLKSPRRLPHSVHYVTCVDLRHYGEPHLHIRNQPLPLGLILADLIALAKAFFSPETQLGLLSKLCQGMVIFASRPRNPSPQPSKQKDTTPR
ncbi:hypothetical protein JCM11491_005213 [Sporobolomyces phaffii]